MPELVLLHPFPFDATFWDALRALVPESVQLHTPDHPGFGDSTQPPADTLDGMATAVHEYVSSKRLERFVLGGVSLGGYAALAYVAKYGAGSLDGVVLVDTRADADTHDIRAQRDASIAQVKAQGTAALVDALAAKLLAPDAPADVVARAKSIMSRQPADSVIAALRAMRERADSTALLSTLDVPALVVCGRHDVVTPPPLMREMAASLPRARFEIVEGAGHLVPLERPEAFAALLQSFLADLPR